MFQQVMRCRRLEKKEKNKRTHTPLPPPSPHPCTQALPSGNCAWRPLWMGFWFLYPGPIFFPSRWPGIYKHLWILEGASPYFHSVFRPRGSPGAPWEVLLPPCESLFIEFKIQDPLGEIKAQDLRSSDEAKE